MDKNNNMFLSIIVPIYNMEQYLPECLASLDKQGFGDEVEILLVDDGSTDRSLKICKNAAVNNACYKVVHQENAGVAAARNTGLAHAVGKYIAWVDPDDYVLDDYYAEIKECINSGYDLFFFDYVSIYPTNHHRFSYDQNSRQIARKEFFEQLQRDIRLKSHLWSKVMLRSYYLGEKTFDIERSFCEDYEALPRVTYKAENIYYLARPLYAYRERQDSIVHEGGRELENMHLAMRLAAGRQKFWARKGINVSDIGYTNRCFIFCRSYQCICKKKEIYYGEYRSTLKSLRYNFLSLFSAFPSLKARVELLMVLAGMLKQYQAIKKKVRSLLIMIVK